eukprot:2668680-Pyramimonas_sp.AAC.1
MKKARPISSAPQPPAESRARAAPDHPCWFDRAGSRAQARMHRNAASGPRAGPTASPAAGN